MAARSTVIESPLGPLRVAAVDAGLLAVRFAAAADATGTTGTTGPGGGSGSTGTADRPGTAGKAVAGRARPLPAGPTAARLLDDAVRRLGAYFAGDARALDPLPVALAGTPFETRVWLALRTIPPGGMLSYADLATRIGTARGARAVGVAVSRNPLPLVLPCHRVVGGDGALVGYGGGLERKAWLLHHEGALLV